uniref:Akirin n=1 Tax=Nyssomyia neivai TaxID=330878 RepID=A0A1L8DCY5_9DIPT
MACATLKRSLDWESINQRPSKRRRCSPYGTNSSATTMSPSARDTACGCSATEPSSSPFAKIPSYPILTPEKMAQTVHDEIKRLHRTKQLSAVAIERMQDSESSGSEMGSDSPRRPDTPPVKNPDKALFTFKQVQLICSRMLKDQEEKLREEYDLILTSKLAEQYDVFVKFTYDQIQRRYEAAPSYLS